MDDPRADRLAILMYHGIVQKPLTVPDWCFLDLDAFRAQMELLAERVRVVPLSEGCDALTGDGDPVVALTFDDGLRSFADLALPILRDFSLPATLFLATDFVDTECRMWFCEVHRAISYTPLASITWDGTRFDLSSIRARQFASATIQARLKAHPQERLLRELESLTAALLDGRKAEGPDDHAFRVLDLPSVKQLASGDLVSIGAHTGSHAILSLLDAEERRDEISRSIRSIEEWTGRPCEAFAYPNGRAIDYTADCVAQLRKLGVRLAVTTEHGANRIGQSALELKRFGIGQDTALDELSSWLTPFFVAPF